MNALKHANRIYGAALFDLDAWAADGTIEASAETRHKLFYRALHDTDVGGRRFRKGQRIDIGHSIKYSLGEAQRLFLCLLPPTMVSCGYHAFSDDACLGLYGLEPCNARPNGKL
jgi:hypothetical protein